MEINQEPLQQNNLNQQVISNPKKNNWKFLIIFVVISFVLCGISFGFWQLIKGNFNDKQEDKILSEIKSRKIISISDDHNTVGEYGELPFYISKDGTQVVYPAQKKNGSYVVVINGEESEEYQKIFKIVISKDRKKIAYVGIRFSKGFVVINNKESRPYDLILSNLIFSPDDSKVAYIAVRGGKQVLVVNDKESKEYLISEKEKRGGYQGVNPVFSPNGNKIAYIAPKGDKKMIIEEENGEIKEGKLYDYISSMPVFSPNGNKIAYRVKNNGYEFVVVDGIEGKKYSPSGVAWEPIFSPDGKTVAYSMFERSEDGSSKYFVVLYNSETKKYKTVGSSGSVQPIFSSDSKKIIFNVSCEVIVSDINGKELNNQKNSCLYINGLGFSQDNEKPMYILESSTENYRPEFYLIEGDDKKLLPFDVNVFAAKSPSGKKYIYIGTKAIIDENGESIDYGVKVIVGNKQGKLFNSAIAKSIVFNRDESKFAYIVMESSGKSFVVVGDKEIDKHDAIFNVEFSDDGKYITYGAKDGKDIWLIVNKINDNGSIESTEKDINNMIQVSAKKEYPKDEKGEIKGESTFVKSEISADKEINIISFKAKFIGEEGSKGLLVVIFDNRIIGTIYEKDVSLEISDYTFRFDNKKPGKYWLEFRAVPLNKQVRTTVEIDEVRTGLVY